MAAVCPINFDTNRLREQVMQTYDRVAREPDGDFHFHRGPKYAVEYLGYDADELATLPTISTQRFAGVGNPHRIDSIAPGETVLDHACGAGMDLLLAARKIGPRGFAVGVDLTPAMRECARRAAGEAGLAERVEIRTGTMEMLPVESESIDVVMSNGVVNLAPDKRQVFREIFRVLKPGGRLLLADVVVQRELTLEARQNPDLWAACIAGALAEPELCEVAAAAGLWGGRITEYFDCFRNTSAENKVSRDLQVRAANFFAMK